MPPAWATGTLSLQSGTGLQAWGSGAGEGFPFLPKAMILWHSGADDYADIQIGESQRYGNRFSIGVTAAPGDSWCSATMHSELDLFGLSNDYSYNAARGLVIPTFSIFGGGLEVKLDVDSYDIITPGVKYGFTLDRLVNTGGFSRKINFIAIGGIEAANVVSAPVNQSGSTVVTGVGFCGDLFIFVGGTSAVDESLALDGLLSFGVANHAGQQWAIGIGGAVNSATSSSSRAQSISRCVLQPGRHAADGYPFASALTVVDEDGFTLANSGDTGEDNYTTGGCKVGVLCLKGIASSIGSFTKRDSVGVQTVPTDVTPLGLLLASFQRASSSTTEAHARIGLGAADLYSNQVAMAAQEADGINATATHADCVAYANAAFVKYDNNAQTVEALAGLSSVGTSNFALGWDPCDAAATQMLFLAVGSGSFGTCEEEDEDEEPPVFNCVEDLTDADLISFRWDAGDQGIVNQLIARFDHDAATDQFTKMLIFEDTASIRKYGPRPPIVIESKGLRTELGADDFFRARAREVFGRFAIPPDVVQAETFYRKHKLEVSDIVCLSSAYVPNLEISGRGVAEKPYEVIDCRPQFGDRGRLVLTLLACRAVSGVPLPPTEGTDPSAPGPEEAVTTLGLAGVGRAVWEIS